MELKYQVYINKQFNELATERLISFEIIDNIGLQLDNLILSINNADKSIEVPSNNSIIELAIGYDDNLYKMGKFIAQYIDASSSVISINAISQDLSRGRIKQNRVFKNKSLDDVLKTLANDLGLTLQINQSVVSKQIDYLIQDNKTSLEILASLSEIFYAVANIKDNNLVFIAKDNIKQLDIQQNNILNIKKVDANNKLYGGVLYESWNIKEAKLETKKLGNEPFLLLQTAVDSSVVNDFLNSKYKEIKESNLINILIQGNPNLQAGFSFEITEEFFPEFKGKYRIERITHKYSNTYVSDIQAVKI